MQKLALQDGSGATLGHLYLDMYTRWGPAGVIAQPGSGTCVCLSARVLTSEYTMRLF